MQTLANIEKSVSVSRFTKTFEVSRQIIVGDTALLQTTDKSIVATARDYILETEEINTEHIDKIAIQYGRDQTEKELRLIVENGSEIIDVIAEYPLCGESAGTLHIKTPQNIDPFIRRYQRSNATLLSKLTGDIHLHTIRHPEKHMSKDTEQKLAEIGVLCEG